MKKMLFILFIGLAFMVNAQTPKEYYELAQDAYEKEDYKSTIKYLDKINGKEYLKPDYYNLKAQSQYELKNYNEAYKTVSIGIERFSDVSSLYNTRGNFLMSFQEYDYAISDMTMAIEFCQVDSELHYFYNNRSAAKYSKRDFEGAYQDLMKAYEYDSTDVATLTNLGAVCDEVGRGDETLKYLLKCIEADSTFYGVYVNIGFKYQEMGEYEKAVEYFDLVLEHDENDPLGYSNRSYCKLKMGDLKGAMKDINQSIKIYPENPYAYRNRALIYLEKGNESKACDDIHTALNKGYTQMYGEEMNTLNKKYCDQ
jgi:tetratricopeptide (TPR) repeat protein